MVLARQACRMDSIGGAKILTARLLRDGGGQDSGEPEVPPIAAHDAIPLFYWAGVEPAAQAENADLPSPRRRWPFRSA